MHSFKSSQHVKTNYKTTLNPIMILWSKSKVATTAIFIILALALLLLLDNIFTAEKIFKGVKVGDVDVSNMTVEQAANAIADTYESRLASTTIYIYADQETANSQQLDLQLKELESNAELISFEEAQKNKKLWIVSAEQLKASIPSYELAVEAYKQGRNGSIIDRFKTSFTGNTIEPYSDFSELELTNLADDINSSIGKITVDYGIKIENDKAVITPGNDGVMLDISSFSNTLSQSFLANNDSIVGIIAELQNKPVQIGLEQATLTCNTINNIIPESVTFSLRGSDTIEITKHTILEWINTRPINRNNLFYLDPYIDNEKYTGALISLLDSNMADNSVSVEYQVSGDDVFVIPKEKVDIPKLGEALLLLDSKLFDSFRESLSSTGVITVDPITVDYAQSSDRLTLSDAISFGVVDIISTYTTKFTNTSSTQGRNKNIFTAANLINNSIAKSGSDWSFLETVGKCDEDSGFTEARIIESGEYTMGIGGGICQVSTTIFNAVYEAGLPISNRVNHSLYSSSYPAGRDAAISYPGVDFIWSNNTNTDILVRAKYSSDSITVILVGNNPEKTVETHTDDWKEGEKYKVVYELDESLTPNTSFIKIRGVNAKSITVKRTVKNKDGSVDFSGTFPSYYAPIDQIVVYGPNTDLPALKEKYEPSKTTSNEVADNERTNQ